MKTIPEGMGRSCDVGHRGNTGLASEEDSAANSLTAFRQFNGILKASKIEKPPGVVAR
jgi:hypothetical protein